MINVLKKHGFKFGMIGAVMMTTSLSVSNTQNEPLRFELHLAEAMAEASPDEINVAVSIRPIHSIVQMVLGDVGNAELMMTGRSSPHGGSMRPSERRALARADLVFMINPRFENAYTKALPPEERLVILSEAEGIVLLNKRLNTNFLHEEHEDHDEHDHEEHEVHEDHAHEEHEDHEGHDEHAHDEHAHEEHAHEEHEDHHGHDHSGHGHGANLVDLHLWLDPEQMIAMIPLIRDRLTMRYPEHGEVFARNAEKSIETLTSLDVELAALMEPVSSRGFITHHDAYAYFEEAYHLSSVAAIFDHHDSSADIKRLRDLRHVIAHNQVVCIFHEPQFNADVVSVIDPKGKLKQVQLDPLSSDIEAGAAFYGKMMRRLSNDLATCLAE